LIADPSLFGPSLAEQPITQIVFRAIENRTAVDMADVAHHSALVDPYGRVLRLARTPEGSPATLVADVPVGRGNALYSRLGDWLGVLSASGLVFVAAFIPMVLRWAKVEARAHEGICAA
jgi:apolipoprotein N-acyltransferase